MRQPWDPNCKPFCGDYFGVDLDPGQSLTYNAAFDQSSLCFYSMWAPDYWPVNAPSPGITESSVPNGTMLTNSSSVRRRVFVIVSKRYYPDICAATVSTPYSIDISIPNP